MGDYPSLRVGGRDSRLPQRPPQRQRTEGQGGRAGGHAAYPWVKGATSLFELGRVTSRRPQLRKGHHLRGPSGLSGHPTSDRDAPPLAASPPATAGG